MEFVQKLRDKAFYVKLESGKKFGGAVDIGSLVKALSSINSSFQGYFEAEARNQIGKKITKSLGKEIGKLTKESELLIVDLSFASFNAAVAPDIVTIKDSYASIPNPLGLKQKVFETYQKDVFFADYSDPKFLTSIDNKFTNEERSRIYRPLFENVFSQEKFKFYFAKNKKSLSLKKTVKGVTESTLENIAPKVVLPAQAAEKLYKVYITSTGEMDLFGAKPKIKKYLATEEMRYPVYPFQIKELEWEGVEISLKKTISADVSYDEGAQIYKIEFPELNILVWGDSREEAEDAFKMGFASLVENFYEEDESNLTTKAIEIKKVLSNIIFDIKVK